MPPVPLCRRPLAARVLLCSSAQTPSACPACKSLSCVAEQKILKRYASVRCLCSLFHHTCLKPRFQPFICTRSILRHVHGQDPVAPFPLLAALASRGDAFCLQRPAGRPAGKGGCKQASRRPAAAGLPLNKIENERYFKSFFKNKKESLTGNLKATVLYLRCLRTWATYCMSLINTTLLLSNLLKCLLCLVIFAVPVLYA